MLWLVRVADVLAAWIARRTEFAADARAVEFGYGPGLLEAYAKLGGPEDRKGRLARLVDFHRRWRSGWPGSERRCQGSVTPGGVSDQITHTAMAITRIDQNG